MLNEAQSMVHSDYEFESRLAAFKTAAPELIASRSLLERSDTKFVVPAENLKSLLDPLSSTYYVVRTNRQVSSEYRTLYFDSEELNCLEDDREEREYRYKVRVRHYPDRRLSFLEMKSRNRSRLTVKHRWEKTYGCNTLGLGDVLALDCIRKSLPILKPRLWANFTRISLISKEWPERVTIDTSVYFESSDQCRSLGNVAIVEVKQATYDSDSPIMQIMSEADYAPVRTSKYVVGAAALKRRLE